MLELAVDEITRPNHRKHTKQTDRMKPQCTYPLATSLSPKMSQWRLEICWFGPLTCRIKRSSRGGVAHRSASMPGYRIGAHLDAGSGEAAALDPTSVAFVSEAVAVRTASSKKDVIGQDFVDWPTSRASQTISLFTLLVFSLP